ncbi:MAG: transposase [Myxococcota bacterium]
MTRLRTADIDLDATSFYHCISRCVRRAFLCGDDSYTGRNFDYRKTWVEDRILELARIFAVEVHAYAVMSNHVHLVVEVNTERAKGWSDREVLRRYAKLFPLAVKRLAHLDKATRAARVVAIRERLADLSWLMRCLNESIARRANREDGCTGRFWEGRFRCQALLDEGAVLACMAYVDLNPVRAGLSRSPRTSKHTSVGTRVRSARKAAKDGTSPVPAGLAPFSDQATSPRRLTLISWPDYLELLDWTARSLGGTSRKQPPDVLRRCGIDAPGFLRVMAECRLRLSCVLGHESALEEFAATQGKAWVRGKAASRQLFR